jgi:hypothetical protein
VKLTTFVISGGGLQKPVTPWKNPSVSGTPVPVGISQNRIQTRPKPWVNSRFSFTHVCACEGSWEASSRDATGLPLPAVAVTCAYFVVAFIFPLLLSLLPGMPVPSEQAEDRKHD